MLIIEEQLLLQADSDLLQYGRDTYSYMWPRDGALVTLAFDKAGYFDISERFYRFCNDVLTDEGYLLHKYNPDLSVGSSWHPWIVNDKPQFAIQVDETALTLFALWQHYVVTKNLEFIESIYNSYIRKTASFLVNYREAELGLPSPSYDLWEERNGISTFTASSVYGGLVAAASFASLLGKNEEAQKYRKTADEVQEAILKHLYDEKEGYFYRQITRGEGGEVIPDRVVDASSAYSVFRFGVLPVGDTRLDRAFEVTHERIGCKTEVGGMARYEGDVYYGVSNEVPGNPWFITTLWQTEYHIAKSKKRRRFAGC